MSGVGNGNMESRQSLRYDCFIQSIINCNLAYHYHVHF